jgi:membrane-associated phospholipid phosphatase
VSARGLLGAGAGILRIAALLAALLTLVLARAGVSLYALVPVVALTLAALYLIDRRRGNFGVFAAYLVGFVLFALLRTTADDTGIAVKGDYVVDAERWLFGGTLPTEWLQDRFYDAGVTHPLDVACVAVYVSYYFAPQVVALVLWRRNPAAFTRYAVAVLVAAYCGLAVSFLVPTAPPWLASEYGHGPDMARVVADVLNWNPERASETGAAGVNPFAAMPSLHLALTALVAVALWRHRWLRPVGIAYLVAMAFSLVYLGEHYVVDELAGLAAAAIGVLVASQLPRVVRRFKGYDDDAASKANGRIGSASSGLAPAPSGRSWRSE